MTTYYPPLKKTNNVISSVFNVSDYNYQTQIATTLNQSLVGGSSRYCTTGTTATSYLNFPRATNSISVYNDPTLALNYKYEAGDIVGTSIYDWATGTFGGNTGGFCYISDSIKKVNSSSMNITSGGSYQTSHIIPATTSSGVSFSMWFYSTSGTTFGIVNSPTSSDFFVQVSSGSSIQYGRSGSVSSVATTISLNTWYHLCVSFTPTIIKIYLNGSLIKTDTTLLVYPSEISRQINIGNQMIGYLDEFVYFNKALSQTEVTQLYSATSTITYITPVTFSGGASFVSGTACMNTTTDQTIAGSKSFGRITMGADLRLYKSPTYIAPSTNSYVSTFSGQLSLTNGIANTILTNTSFASGGTYIIDCSFTLNSTTGGATITRMVWGLSRNTTTYTGASFFDQTASMTVSATKSHTFTVSYTVSASQNNLYPFMLNCTPSFSGSMAVISAFYSVLRIN